ncbi:glycosyltransferase [Microbacterium sp. 1P10UB]|uniref:glycosyltransferase n=1 Tax=unclassified Microbacterium TaxID=2609290 RepID=UPI0039A1CE34
MSRRMLFAASTGGHLAQLVRLSDRFEPAEDSLWVTFRTPQSESLLEGRNVLHVPYIRPRDSRTTFSVYRQIRRLLRAERFDQAVSTGAALAVAVLPAARMAGIESTYIESVSRVDGPSQSGKILKALRAADLHTQHAAWSDRRWRVIPGVLNDFEAHVARPEAISPRLFVTLGTIEGFRFDAMIDAVLATGLADDRTVWQVGVTDRHDLPGEVRSEMSASEFHSAAVDADVVITHSGVGTILQLLDAGIYPIVVPRSRRSGEHVDDHQHQIARVVSEGGIAISSMPGDLTAGLVHRASTMRVSPVRKRTAV